MMTYSSRLSMVWEEFDFVLCIFLYYITGFMYKIRFSCFWYKSCICISLSPVFIQCSGSFSVVAPKWKDFSSFIPWNDEGEDETLCTSWLLLLLCVCVCVVQVFIHAKTWQDEKQNVILLLLLITVGHMRELEIHDRYLFLDKLLLLSHSHSSCVTQCVLCCLIFCTCR